jgi:hypothetical protein
VAVTLGVGATFGVAAGVMFALVALVTGFAFEIRHVQF